MNDSMIEALRALEKKWEDRAQSLAEQIGEQRDSDFGNMAAGFLRLQMDEVDRCRSELAALLSSRQEVAPVAWGVRSVHAECGDLWMCDFGLATIWKENADRYADWLNENNAVDGPFVVVGFHDYTTTDQTSDARDGARLDWIAANRVAVYPELDGPWYADVYRDGEEGEVTASHHAATPREAIDAAMQEAGK